MAAGEVVLLQRVCLGRGGHAVFWLCRHCDRGHRYGSLSCRLQARLLQRRAANRRHQRSPEGGLDHRDRQRIYRHRQAQARVTRLTRVTDQSSLSIASAASSPCGTLSSTPVESHTESALTLPAWPDMRPGVRLYCRICGRPGRLVNSFPRIPPRR